MRARAVWRSLAVVRATRTDVFGGAVVSFVAAHAHPSRDRPATTIRNIMEGTILSLPWARSHPRLRHLATTPQTGVTYISSPEPTPTRAILQGDCDDDHTRPVERASRYGSLADFWSARAHAGRRWDRWNRDGFVRGGSPGRDGHALECPGRHPRRKPGDDYRRARQLSVRPGHSRHLSGARADAGLPHGRA